MKMTKWAALFVLVLLLLAVSAVLADTSYTVQPGDSLAKIALKFGTTVEAIVEANDISDPNLIQVGMVLTIPGSSQLPAETEDAAVLPPDPAQIVNELVFGTTPAPDQYVVQLGDSLAKIAAEYGLDYLSLAFMNAIKAPFIIQAGQVLEIPNPLLEMPDVVEMLQQLAPDTDVQPEEAQPQAEDTGVQSVAQTTTAAVVQAPVRVYETTVSIPVYNFEEAFQPTSEDDDIYPYPRLDHGKEVSKETRTYKAVVLENGYVEVTVLPELGGRVYGWKDKATGRQLLYQNPVINPTNWGYRGWWLAAGGIEWAFPVEEHGLNEWRPWSYSVGANSVTVSDVEDRTGMEVGATISLSPDDAVMTLKPWARNNTGSAHPYQLWLNGMMTLGGNSVSGETQFIIPADEVKLHSTGDEDLPAPGEMMDWPVHNGRNLGVYNNWDNWLGFFAPTGIGYAGLYDHSNGQGIVRAFSPGWPAGTKIFGPGSLPSYLWTDDDSGYVELWSGATNSFWDYATLEPGQTVTWEEYWYPVNNLGGYNFANRHAALLLNDKGNTADVALGVSVPIKGTLILYAGNEAAANWPVDMGPGQALTATWQRSSGHDGDLGLRLVDPAGAVLAQTGQVP